MKTFQRHFRIQYKRSHRISLETTWKYTFPNATSKRWIIALRHQPELPWSTDIKNLTEIKTQEGWKPFEKVSEGSSHQRAMWRIDHRHDDPTLKSSFEIRTRLTATLHEQKLIRWQSPASIPPLRPEERQMYLEKTPTYDFDLPAVKKWIKEQDLYKSHTETDPEFAYRLYQKMRNVLPYSTADGGPWICSRILQAGFGECCRHGIVDTSILRINGIPARTVCALWGIDDKSRGAHCWCEFFWEGVGWVPLDTSSWNPSSPISDRINTDEFFGNKPPHFLGGMIDFDWVIDSGVKGRVIVPGIDAFPAFWHEGTGYLGGSKLETQNTSQVLARY